MKKKTALSIVLFSLCLLLLFFASLPFIQTVGANISFFQNQSVRVITRVNISNAPPFVSNMTVQFPINLIPNQTTNVTCNATVLDFNNWSDIKEVNATFFSTNISRSPFADTNRSHYSVNCTSSVEITQFEKLYICSIQVAYNAFFDNWTCNISASDRAPIPASNFITTTVNDLVSFSVPDELNFGDVPVLNTSSNYHLNFTNVGNQPLNFTAYAYGIYENDSTVMICEQGNITIGNLFFSKNLSDISSDIPISNMTQVNNTNATASLLGVIADPFNETLRNPVNGTTWRLRVPLGPFGTPYGLCNGSLIVRATKAFNSVN